MKKRLFSLLLAVVLVAGGTLSKVNTAKAAAVLPIGINAEVTAELIAFFGALLSTAAVSAGVSEGLGSYSESQDIVSAFRDFCDSFGPDSDIADMEVTLADGSVVTYSQAMDLIEFVCDTDGSSALAQGMSEEEAAAYREAVKSKLQVLDGGGGSSGEDPDNGSDNNLFNNIKTAILNSAFLAKISVFFH